MINFKQLLQKKPEHPLGSIEGARKVLAELPAGQPLLALEQVSFWLGSLHDVEAGGLAERIAVIRMLDEAAQPKQRSVGREYLAASRMNKALENLQWMTLFEFWKRLANNYFDCLERIEKDCKVGGLASEMLPLCVRAMQALGVQIKLRHWRYRPADERIWSAVAKLYQLTESKGWVESRVTLAGSTQQTSLKQELLKILMLEIAAPDRMLPAQIELADRLIGQLADGFVLQREQDGCAHYFDLSARKPPARLLQGGRTHSLMRFFAAGEALARLQQTLRQVNLSVEPQDVLGDDIDNKNELQDLLRQLGQTWSPTPPQRKHERKTIVSRLNVVHGMADIIQQLGMPAKKPAGWQQGGEEPVLIESWVMENISESGLGAIIPELAEEWVGVGTLLGLRPEGGEEWSIGVVRRLKRTPRMEIYVGIEILSHEPEKVALRPKGLRLAVTDNVTSMGKHDEVPAMLLSRSPDDQGGRLLCAPGLVQENRDYELLHRNEWLGIRLAGVAEQGHDYEQVNYSLLTKTAAKH